MKKIITSIFALSIVHVGFAQVSLSPQVYASAGTHYTASNFQISYTIGETVTSTIQNNNNILTQGFHQPDKNTSGVEIAENNWGIQVFPNPTSDLLNIQLNNNNNRFEYQMFDDRGRLVEGIQFNGTNTSKNISQYRAGTYMLVVRDILTNQTQTFPVVKFSPY
jgi:hypothetical protein